MKPLTIDQRIQAIDLELTVLRSRIQDHDTGHIHTTIHVLEDRLKELHEEHLEEQKQRNL